MNRICKLFLTILNLVFIGVYGQNQNDSVVYNPTPIYSDDLNYITTTSEEPFYSNTRTNIVSSANLNDNNSIFKSGTAYKGNGFLVFKGGSSNKLTSIDLSNIILPEDTSIDKYYIRFNFKVRSILNTGTQMNIKFFESQTQEFIPINDSRFGNPTKNYSITSVYADNSEEINVEIELDRNKIVKFFEMKPVDNFPGYLIDEINVYTSVSPSKITKFDGYRWTNGTPNYEKDVVLDINFPFVWQDEIKANSLKINPNNNITIAPGVTVKLNNELIVDESSNLTFLEGAYLLQYNEEAVNIGNVTFNRSSKPMFRLQSNLWSSPVTGLKLVDFSPRTLVNRFYTYNALYDTWDNIENINDATFAKGIGYSIRTPNNFNNYIDENSIPKIFNGVFKGVPINGYVPVDLNNSQFNSRYHLIGNPYPSPLIVNTIFDFFDDDIESVEIFKHSIPIDYNSPNGTYLSNDNQYFVINRGGSNDPGNETYRIDIGQAFFVKTKENVSSTTISFANQYFRYEPEDDMLYDPFAPIISYRKPQVKIEDKLWLALKSDLNQISSISIGFSEYTTDDFDESFDSKSIDSDYANGLYSELNSDKYVIQNFGNFDDSKIIPLTLKVNKLGQYTIDLTGKKGIFETQSIYLLDSYINEIFDISNGISYQFNTESGEFSDRFKLVFKESLLTQEQFKSPISIYTSDQSITIQSKSEDNYDFKIFDMLGQLIYSSNFKNKTVKNLDKGIYLILIEKDGGVVINKKVIIN